MVTTIETSGLGKAYRHYGGGAGRLIELGSLGLLRRHRLVWALRGLDLALERGAMLGVVGANGSGKSTLLRVLAGASAPTAGAYRVRGRVASLLELGAGFHPELTGRENLTLAWRLAGVPGREARRLAGPALDFARLGPAADEPVRTYSSGMAVRLGFAAATAVVPDVLLLDEVLAVGDLAFQERCVERVLDFRRQGVTVVFASHSLYDVRQLCDVALWLERGESAGFGEPDLVTNAYAARARERAEAPKIDATGEFGPTELPRIESVELDPPGPLRTGDDLSVRVRWRAPGGRRVQVGVALATEDRRIVAAAATHLDGLAPEPAADGAVASAVLELPALPLLSGSFRAVAYLFDGDGVQRWDERPAPGRLTVLAGTSEVGEVRVAHRWRFERAAAEEVVH